MLTKETWWILIAFWSVHQMHHDILCSYPSGVIPLGASPVCEVQGMFRPQKFLTLQGHPEFNGEIMVHLLKASDDLGFEDKTLFEDAMSRVHDDHDGTIVAATMLKFLIGELDIWLVGLSCDQSLKVIDRFTWRDLGARSLARIFCVFIAITVFLSANEFMIDLREFPGVKYCVPRWNTY